MQITEIVERLKDGNQRFVEDRKLGELQDQARRKELVDGQSPFAIILSCADSRVAPELTFDTGLGELFVVRVAGNVANKESIASIEYAVAHCHSKVIIVLGHESCGAVAAAIKGGDNGENLNCLLGHLTPVVEANKDSDFPTTVKANVGHVVGQLKSQSEILSNALSKEEIKIIPAYYNLGTGKVDFLD